MTERRSQIALIVASAITLSIAVIVSIIFYYLFFEKSWLRYTNIPFPAMQSSAKPGEPMPIHVARCNDDNVPHVYTVTRSLERVTLPGETRDSIMLTDITLHMLPGCSEADSVVHIIPANTRSGKWQLVGLSEVQGVLKRHLVEWYSVPFRVEDK